MRYWRDELVAVGDNTARHHSRAMPRGQGPRFTGRTKRTGLPRNDSPRRFVPAAVTSTESMPWLAVIWIARDAPVACVVSVARVKSPVRPNGGGKRTRVGSTGRAGHRRE